MGKKKDDGKGPIESVAIDPFVLGPGERCERGEILTLDVTVPNAAQNWELYR